MAHLLYYQKEREVFKFAWDRKLDTSEARIVFDKLCRHYKIDPFLDWTSGRNHPKAWGTYKVRLNYDFLNFGIICHELGHIFANKKYGNGVAGHTKKHWNIMKRMISYCEKKQWFAEELARRTAIKIPKQVNPIEEKQKELIKAQEKIIKYEKKIMFYQRKLAKARKSYNMRKRHFDNRNLPHNSVIAKENEQSNIVVGGENE